MNATALAPAKAKYATPLTPGLVNYGECVALVAEYLGTPLMPWQRQVADVITQLDPVDPRRWRYRTVVITVPRQAGKSALLRALAVDRILRFKDHIFMMTAQTGQDARKRWSQIAKALEAAKKKDKFELRESQGSERLLYKKRNSFVAPFAPTKSGIHGDTLNTVTIDEAWAFDDAAGATLNAAIKPTFLTVPDAQLIIVSTRGTAASGYLNKLIKEGRKSVKDPNSRMAYFEWSADEEAAERDMFSEETLSFHPALGITQSIQDILDLYDGDREAFRRGVLNLETTTETTAIDLAIWGSLARPDLAPPPGVSYAVGYSVAHDGSGATICAAWPGEDGDIHLAPIAQAPGRTWIAPALESLSAKGVRVITTDNSGPSRTTYDEVKQVLPTVECLNAGQYGTACQALLDRVKAGTLAHSGDLAFTDAIKAAATRTYGGVVGFDEAKSAGPIDAIKAAANALYGAANLLPKRRMVM